MQVNALTSTLCQDRLRFPWSVASMFYYFVFMQSLAEDMKSKAQSLGLTSEVVDLKNYEPEDSLSEEV